MDFLVLVNNLISDKFLYETILCGYLTLFEARSLPKLTEVDSNEPFLDPLSYQKRFATSNHIQYIVCANDAHNFPINIIVNLLKLPENPIPTITDEIWQINFTTDNQRYDITTTGSISLFNSTMSLIKLLLERYGINYITFAARDSDANKEKQKARIYSGYVKYFGFEAIEQQISKSRIVYHRI